MLTIVLFAIIIIVIYTIEKSIYDRENYKRVPINKKLSIILENGIKPTRQLVFSNSFYPCYIGLDETKKVLIILSNNRSQLLKPENILSVKISINNVLVKEKTCFNDEIISEQLPLVEIHNATLIITYAPTPEENCDIQHITINCFPIKYKTITTKDKIYKDFSQLINESYEIVKKEIEYSEIDKS